MNEFDHSHICAECILPYGCNGVECWHEDAELYGGCKDHPVANLIP